MEQINNVSYAKMYRVQHVLMHIQSIYIVTTHTSHLNYLTVTVIYTVI